MRFKIIDNHGNKYTVDEIKKLPPRLRQGDAEKPEEAKEEKPVEKKMEEVAAFTIKEVKALKELAALAPDLKALFEVEKDEHGVEEFKKPDKKEKGEKKSEDKPEEDLKEIEKVKKIEKDEDIIGAEDEFEEEFDDEKVIECDGCDSLDDVDDIMVHDSKQSFGSIEKKSLGDSLINEEDDINEAWAKRYSNK